MKTLHTNYKVATSDITVTVVVGNGQLGNTLVAVGSEELANGPNITNLVIGKGSDVAGKARPPRQRTVVGRDEGRALPSCCDIGGAKVVHDRNADPFRQMISILALISRNDSCCVHR